MIRSARKHALRVEYGDYQTPLPLAGSVCTLLKTLDICPQSIVEPTCGRGSFICAAIDAFPALSAVVGVDVNPHHVEQARSRFENGRFRGTWRIHCDDFFATDWDAVLAELPDPILLIGNPPWVTNAVLGAMESRNVPVKSNLKKLKGLDARTGKSNFDISEWMLFRLIDALHGRPATAAFILKTSVARRVLEHLWKAGRPVGWARLFRIDAESHFDAAVDACVLVVAVANTAGAPECQVYHSFRTSAPESVFGLRDGRLVPSVRRYDECAEFIGAARWEWRTGIKHDCARVLELRQHGDGLVNGLGEQVDIEREHLFPLLKSSDVAGGRVHETRRWLLVTQRTMGEDPERLRDSAPRTWKYLQTHAGDFEARRSRIYRNRPRFCLFGVGGYSFAPWKVAISGLYKKYAFHAIGPISGRSPVVDDTINFTPCQSRQEAECITEILQSDPARRCLDALVFWENKRPITVDILRCLDITRLAAAVGRENELGHVLGSGAPRGQKLAERSLFGVQA